ncbi:L-2-amino-thiazoline-4-carboxylic acid hydrolase [Clostridium sp. Cult2]|uniref:L-2-amino-thiazoline-4-carboxylic acid hydrolase n=1 Tax=Clostridium sp. Cult2 TaxID=2079003 RepID=UPI001F46B2E1|nr:L-2-amino-thiazoline-4-carboxylic acid hydrolase [Clostridium sp. Cult2]
MKRTEELLIENCQDAWPKLYYYLAFELIQEYGLKGEKVVRNGVRKFGIDRGETLRKMHIKYGIDINMKSLFTYYDLPGDPRFRRRQISLTEEQRLSETLVCPIAELWIDYNAKAIGRIYCEEFHHAMWGAYAEGTQVNLGQTLTQDGDNHCRFSVYYRKANAKNDIEENKAEFTPLDYKEPHYRDGVEMLATKIFNHITLSALDIIGVNVLETIKNSTRLFAIDLAKQQKDFAKSLSIEITDEWLSKYLPFKLNQSEPFGFWLNFDNDIPFKIFKEVFYPNFEAELSRI